MSDRKALNIGINQFANYPQFTLRGCVNDAKNFSKVLVDYLNFSEEDIIELVDEQATKANIINYLRSIVDEAKQGRYSYVVLKLSTHGTSIPDNTPEEVDHLDEAFVPYDIAQKGDNWDRDHIIVDDELAEILAELPPNVLFEGFGDTCHSGTGIRMAELLRSVAGLRSAAMVPETIVRYVEPVRTTASSRSAATLLQAQGLQRHGIREALVDEEMRNHVWWSGCRDDQTSADANIEGVGWNGAMTYYLCEEIRKSGNRKSRADLMDGLRSALAGKYTQVPQLLSRSTYHQFPIGSWDRSATPAIISPSPSSTIITGGTPQAMQIPISSLPIVLQMLWNIYTALGRREEAASSPDIAAGSKEPEKRSAAASTTTSRTAESKEAKEPKRATQEAA